MVWHRTLKDDSSPQLTKGFWFSTRHVALEGIAPPTFTLIPYCLPEKPCRVYTLLLTVLFGSVAVRGFVGLSQTDCPSPEE
jgi:hypothetical protein